MFPIFTISKNGIYSGCVSGDIHVLLDFSKKSIFITFVIFFFILFFGEKFLIMSGWVLWGVKTCYLGISSRKFTLKEKMAEKGRLYAQGLNMF